MKNKPAKTKKRATVKTLTKKNEINFKKIMEVLGETDVCEFEYSKGDMHIVIKKEPVSVMLGEAEHAPALKKAPKEDEAHAQTRVRTLTSPAVGTFHISDGNTLLSAVGKKIKKGSQIGWVNSMGIKQEIMTDKDVKITAILCKDREVVEWGQRLFEIEEENV